MEAGGSGNQKRHWVRRTEVLEEDARGKSAKKGEGKWFQKKRHPILHVDKERRRWGSKRTRMFGIRWIKDVVTSRAK